MKYPVFLCLPFRETPEDFSLLNFIMMLETMSQERGMAKLISTLLLPFLPPFSMGSSLEGKNCFHKEEVLECK